MRYSGAFAREEIGPIAQTFIRQIDVFAGWFSEAPFRQDVPAILLAEGVQAFATQCLALNFCAIHSDQPIRTRLRTYLDAWLCPQKTSECK
jgi:hypothetical protein